MSGLAITIIVGLVLFMSLMVMWPFWSKNNRDYDQTKRVNGEQQTDKWFDQLSDLEYDYRMGKISAADYENIKEELSANLAQYMDFAAVTQTNIERDADDEIDRYLKEQGMVPDGGRAEV